jgi:hypothetical protein
MSTRQKALQQTPVSKRSLAGAEPAPHAKPQQARFHNVPDRFTYALKDYTAERRANGWYISRTWAVSVGEKPQWVGPFATIETACLSIARRIAIELADRHTQSIERYGIERDHGLYGLKATTRLHPRRKKPKETGSAL